jgi:NAD(P)-dependent dehydrogenase (short-subunit alcohol dehydrogenase family)
MKGKVALVTGGSSGIGQSAALAFAREGAQVVIASRNKPKAAEVVRLIQNLGGEVVWIQTDVTNSTEVQALIGETMAKFGRLDYAFNNAGSGGKMALTADVEEEDWDSAIDGFLKSVWLCMKYEIREMLRLGGGVIVNNSSVDGVRGYSLPGGASYSAAKHGVIGLTKSAALEYVGKGIRINAICPGWIATPPVQSWMDHDVTAAAQIVAQEPIGRLGKPEEIADAVVWLCSNRATFMVGATLAIDGGYLA